MQKSAAETKRAADAAETAWALAMQKAAAQTSAASEATERSAASQQRISAAYSDLLATLNPLAAAQQRYNQQVAAIQAYHQQASSSAEALKADLDALNAAYARAGSPINQFGQVTGVAGTRANTLGLVLQQTGYQVGDFAVQVQSGTNAFVAFGQQATQLAGLLYLIPGAIGVIAGTVASIGIPVVTAFLAYWDRTSEAKQGVDDLNDALKNLQSTTKNAEAELARARFGAASLEEARAMLEQEDLLRKLTAARKAYADTTQLLVENPYSLRAADVARAAVIELRALEDQARVLEEQLDKYREMEAARAKQQRDAEWLTMNQQNALDAALEWFDAQVAGQQAAYEAAEETRKAAEEGRQLAVELADSYASALGIANSNMAGAVNNAAAAAAILAQRLGVSMQTARAMSGLATMTPEQRRVAVGVRTGVIPPVALQSMGITPEQMSSLGLRGSEAGQPGAPTIFPGDPGPNTPLFRPPSTGAGSSGSGRAAVDEQAEAFERLRRSIDDTYRAQQMFTEGKAILDAQFADKNSAEYLRLLDLLKQKYPEVAGAANDFGNQLQQISNVMSRSMEDAFMSIIDGSQSAGEAFKGMARTIIAEVVKIMVIRPLVRGILGIFGLSANADGGIFSGGSRMAFANGGAFYNGNVTPFADGGVVSSPTLFPMRNGTGLMGEAGPEAIMPLKRTSSGKLGVVAEGGSGTVNQTLVFNIAANGDESVRRIVRDEAPLIAEQAKAAVLDAKRRGGAYGRAF